MRIRHEEMYRTITLYIDAILLHDKLTEEFRNAAFTFNLRRAIRIAKLLQKTKKRMQRRKVDL